MPSSVLTAGVTQARVFSFPVHCPFPALSHSGLCWSYLWIDSTAHSGPLSVLGKGARMDLHCGEGIAGPGVLPKANLPGAFSRAMSSPPHHVQTELLVFGCVLASLS